MQSRNIPALLVAFLAGTLFSILLGYVVASYVVGDAADAYTLRPAAHSRTTLDRDPSTELTTVEQIAARTAAATPTENNW